MQCRLQQKYLGTAPEAGKRACGLQIYTLSFQAFRISTRNRCNVSHPNFQIRIL